MKYLGQIDSVENFKYFCEGYREVLEKDKFYHKGRKILDWVDDDFNVGYGRFEDLINRFDGYSKSLLLFYKKGGELRLHRDSSDYSNTAYSVSSEDFKFIHDGNEYDCKKGNIYTFNSKLIHGIEKINKDRWCLVWWK